MRRMDAPSPDGRVITTRPAALEDAERIAEIYNQGIEDRIATFETALHTALDRREWLEANPDRPVVVATREGLVVGFALAGMYRERECYRGIGEYSVYVDRKARGSGVGRLLMEALIAEAALRGYWKLTSRIFVHNHASRKLALAVGFREVGIYEKHARLDGTWLDCVIVERLIPENLT